MSWTEERIYILLEIEAQLHHIGQETFKILSNTNFHLQEMVMHFVVADHSVEFKLCQDQPLDNNNPHPTQLSMSRKHCNKGK